MTDPLVEKIARALCVADGHLPDEIWRPFRNGEGRPAWRDFINPAQAALSCIPLTPEQIKGLAEGTHGIYPNEPTEAMVDDGADAYHNVKADRGRAVVFPIDWLPVVYRAMLSAAPKGESDGD